MNECLSQAAGSGSAELSRRDFLKATGAAAAAASFRPWPAGTAQGGGEPAETYVKRLYDSLTSDQRRVIVFGWNYQHPRRGLLRTHVANNWRITEPEIHSDFFTGDQKEIGFRGADGGFPGIPVAELSGDQREELEKTLRALLDPFRASDRREVLECLGARGGLDGCSLAFYRSGDIGGDGVWDNWRIEGPSFVWYFRGSPHVHVWVNVAREPSVPTNSAF